MKVVWVDVVTAVGAVLVLIQFFGGTFQEALNETRCPNGSIENCQEKSPSWSASNSDH